MKRTVTAVQARQRLGELLEGVYYRGDEVLIERAGKTMAVVVPLDRYKAMNASRERLFALIERAQSHNRDVPFEVIEKEVEAAIQEVRAKRRPNKSRP